MNFQSNEGNAQKLWNDKTVSAYSEVKILWNSQETQLELAYQQHWRLEKNRDNLMILIFWTMVTSLSNEVYSSLFCLNQSINLIVKSFFLSILLCIVNISSM